MRMNPLGKRARWAVSAAMALLLVAHSAFAGAPLKGVGVSLGKSPGGGCAARTTGPDGKANFGVWPEGNYTLEFAPAPSPAATGQATNRSLPMPTVMKVHVVISGATGGKMERDVNAGAATERTAPISFSLDGKQPLVVVVSAAN